MVIKAFSKIKKYIYFLLKCKYILVTSELFPSEELTDLVDSNFDIVEGVRRQRDIYKAREMLKAVPRVWGRGERRAEEGTLWTTQRTLAPAGRFRYHRCWGWEKVNVSFSVS